jgi:hypothetical protein
MTANTAVLLKNHAEEGGMVYAMVYAMFEVNCFYDVDVVEFEEFAGKVVNEVVK